MTMEERIARADEKINSYWKNTLLAEDIDNSELHSYWLARWGAASEIYEILTDKKWTPVE